MCCVCCCECNERRLGGLRPSLFLTAEAQPLDFARGPAIMCKKRCLDSARPNSHGGRAEPRPNYRRNIRSPSEVEGWFDCAHLPWFDCAHQPSRVKKKRSQRPPSFAACCFLILCYSFRLSGRTAVRPCPRGCVEVRLFKLKELPSAIRHSPLAIRHYLIYLQSWLFLIVFNEW
jgi:hypothetical protein